MTPSLTPDVVKTALSESQAEAESRVDAVVRALASHQCGPGSNPGPGVICGLSLSPGSPVFLPPQKPTFLNSNSIGNSRATGLSVLTLLCATLVKQS